MANWAPLFRLLGSPRALNAWSFIIVLPTMLVLALGAGWRQASSAEIFPQVLPLILGHFSTAALGLLIWYLLFYRAAQPPSPVVTLASFAFLGAARIVFIDLAFVVVGLTPQTITPARIALSIVLMVELFAIVAIVTGLIDRSLSAARELARAEVAIQELGWRRRHRSHYWEEDVLGSIRAQIDAVVVPWRVSPPESPAVAAAQLERLVRDVIRPMSHQVSDEETSSEPLPEVRSEPETSDGTSGRLPKGWWHSIELIRPRPFLLVAVPIMVLYSFERFGFGVELALIAGLVPLLGGGFLAIRWLQQRLPSDAGLAKALILVGGLFSLGTMANTLLVVIPRTFGLDQQFVWAAPVILVGVGSGMSVAARLVQVASSVEQDASTALREVAEQVAEEQIADREQARQMSSLLHSGVQAELVAWMVALRQPGFIASELPLLVEELAARLDKLFDGGEASSKESARDQVRALVAAWSAARPIELQAEADCWIYFDQSAERTANLITVVSEAISNAFRHGREGSVAVRLDCLGDGSVELVVTNPGILRSARVGADAGLGLETIRELCESVSLSQDGGRVKLRARFAA